MYLWLDPDRSILTQPSSAWILEGGTINSENMQTTAPIRTDGTTAWESTPEFEGVNRRLMSVGGRKAGIVSAASAPGGINQKCYVWSAYADEPTAIGGVAQWDTSNRQRSMLKWRGLNCCVVRNRTFWGAGKYYFDFDIGPGGGAQQHILFNQIHHNSSGANMNPPIGITYEDNGLRCIISSTTTPGVEVGDPAITKTKYDSLVTYASLNRVWFDLVWRVKVSPYIADTPFFELYLNGALVVNHLLPIGYVSPSSTGETYYEEWNVGSYPGVWNTTTNIWSPKLPREVYGRRQFCCLDGGYSLAQIRGIVNA
jgi:hypothetical protein